MAKLSKANNGTKEIPVIFLTAKTEISDLVKGFNYGAVDYITKPLTAQFQPGSDLIKYH